MGFPGALTWAEQQVTAASDAGERVVLQPVTNLNSGTGGVAAFVGLRVQSNPEFLRVYSRYGDSMRWGISRDAQVHSRPLPKR